MRATIKELKKLIDTLDIPKVDAPQTGSTGYLDRWSTMPKKACWGIDQNGRMFFVTGLLWVVQNASFMKAPKEYPEIFCIFQRYPERGDVLTSTGANMSGPWSAMSVDDLKKIENVLNGAEIEFMNREEFSESFTSHTFKTVDEDNAISVVSDWLDIRSKSNNYDKRYYEKVAKRLLGEPNKPVIESGLNPNVHSKTIVYNYSTV